MQGWSALILAAGAGRRFDAGAPGGKLLADLGGAPVIRRVTERVVATGLADVLVVTGAAGGAIRSALAGLGCRICDAPGWDEGMAVSLRAGIAALPPEAAGVIVFLGDMPLVPAALIGGLARQAQQAGLAARPLYHGQPGHPVAFTRAAFDDLMRLQGDAGATALLRARPDLVAYCETEDRGAVADIDSPEDLAAMAAAWNACATSATSDSATSRGVLEKP